MTLIIDSNSKRNKLTVSSNEDKISVGSNRPIWKSLVHQRGGATGPPGPQPTNLDGMTIDGGIIF